MTSPSSSIVVVDKSGSVDASNLIQSSQHVHQAQHQPIRAQQVILNEEYLSGDNIVRAGNVNYLIPMPSSAAPMIKPTTINQHPNSKVHVISNVTLVSKADQSQSQTINFVNSKHLQSSSTPIGSRASVTGGNYVNISTKSQLQHKMFKSSAIDQQTHIVTAQQQANQQQQQQQQHIITKHLNNASAIVQKVIPRNILVSTGRMQNKMEPTTITRTTTPMAQHQTNQIGNVIQIQKSNAIAINKASSINVNNVKSTKANQQQHAIKLVNQTIGGVGGSINSAATIKHGNASVVKTITSTAISAMSNPTTIQPKNQTKTSYSMQTAKVQHQQPPAALQPHPKSQLSSVHSNISTHSRNNNNNNNNTINANTKLVQHTTQRTVMSINNMCVQPNVIGQKITTTKNTSTGKYMTQISPNISNMSQTPCMSTVPYRSNELLQGNDQRVTTTYRTIQPTEARTTASKSITMINHPVHVNAENNCQQPVKRDAEWNQFSRHRNGVEIGYHEYQAASDVGKKSTTMPSSVDDVIMVNGTHMSEEMSARILQSLSQKVVFHSNNNIANSSNATNVPPSRNMQPTQSHRQSQPISHRAIQPAPYKASQPSRPYVEYPNKSGPEYFRVNTSDIQTTTSTFVDNIPLISTRGDEYCSNANDVDDDIIGEEVRPKPIDSSMDIRMQALHALLQDHTYVQWPVEKQAQLSSTCSPTKALSIGVPPSSSVPINVPEPSQPSLLSPSSKTKQSTTGQPVENLATGTNVPVPNQATSPIVPANKFQQQSNPAPLIPGYSFAYNTMMNKDEDANSAISNGSRNKSDIDQGEETETAPEAGNEDDSVTRCICELSHDDGYMICCDKCSVWQHVDCMGIDRQNIPEEYKCELCQPREIDQNRARMLQLMKRKEQQNFLMMKQSNQISGIPADSNATQGTNSGDRSQLNAFSTIVANKKKGTLSAKSRKGDLFGASNLKRKRSDSSRGSKRRESKKSLSKRKSHSGPNSNSTTPVKPNSVPGGESDKQSLSLRQWIENYEIAMTNHYSPELRARLQTIIKQMTSSTAALPALKNISSLDSKCTTVPHAGAKILISTREIAPNNPVIEIRGKYMLSTQFKPQQQSNSPTSANGTRNFSKMNPGPFMFFYRLPNDGPEICVDTRTYGNEARFVRRSCRPNAEIVHSIEKGTPHLYIVSLNTIRSSTEITIKHEPHDLEALERSEINAPTSTICGCGLIKDCMFGVSGSSTSAVSQPNTPTSTKKTKKPNGHLKDKSSPHRKKSKAEKIDKPEKADKAVRNQPDVPSGANAGVLSPTASKASVEDLDSTKLSENALSKTPLEKSQKDVEKSNDKSNRKNNNSIDVVWTADQNQDQTFSSPKASDSLKTKDSVDGDQTPSSPSKPLQDTKFDGQSRSMKSPPSTPISMKSPPAKSSSNKKTTRKSTCSFSEDTGDEYSGSASKDKDTAKGESKKLTREERKMEAIVRAFEKMEKSAQRKNEQNKQKTTTTSSAPIGGNNSLSKKRSASFGKDDSDKMKKSNIQSSKRKRKRGKSYSQPSSQKRRRNRYDSHNSDDGNTSDESSTPMMSPTRLHDLDRHQRTSDDRDKGQNDNLAAGLLLSLSSYGVNKNADKNNCLSSPDRYSATNKSQSNTPPFAVSSACLLIEAAVGPLDNDFKLPTKAKTKKSIMNEWLHQSDGSSSYPSHNSEHRLLSPSTSMDNYSHTDSNTNSYSHEEPRNLSIAAQKIEEFIQLTSGEHMDDDECSKWSGSPICTSSDAITVPTPLPTPPLQMGSSVKKRWLRQAISEECSDELIGCSATSSPPNGFMAPLKKRRVARQCSDLNAEDVPSPKEDLKDLVLDEENSESASKDDIMKVSQDEKSKAWPDVDIKVESESEIKEPKDEAESGAAPKTDTPENRMILDVDKFEPIESDEDDEMCDRLEIKTEIEDSQDKSMMSTEAYKQEPISEDSKSQDNADTHALTPADNSRADDDFDLEDSKPENDENKSDVSLLSNVLPKNEIEDIQQKLHSFHSENLMILQTRNKKRASRATTPTSDEVSNSNTVLKDFEMSSTSSSEHVSKSRKFSADDREYKHEPSTKNDGGDDHADDDDDNDDDDDDDTYNQYQPPAALPTIAPVISQPLTPNFSSYVLNSSHRIEPTQALPPAQIYQSTPPPSFTNPPPSANIPASSSLYHYLENPSRTPAYNSGYNAPHMFTMNTSVPPPTLLNSSNYLTKSYSTLSEPSTPVANIPSSPIGVTPSPSTAPINPKVLSRTQSADPRLNPPKELPPVTPKRKLSINEYRKRKQLTTSTEKPKVESSEKIESTAEPIKATTTEDKPKNGMAVADAAKETVFSPAPTLLEIQQENLSKRLKSYKSLHGLSTGIESTKSKDSTLENEISTSISEALNASSSSSLTSVSSPKSDRDDDFEDADEALKSPEEMKDEPSTSEIHTEDPVNVRDEIINETSENDFDLEPAEPPQSENVDSIETAASQVEH